MSTAERVTYATLAAGQTEEFRKKYDEAVERVRASFGKTHPHRIDGQELMSPRSFEDRSPVDTRLVIGSFPIGTKEDVDRAILAAKRGFPEWSGRPWQERSAIIRKAADLIEERGFELSALVSLEAGKNRLEAMGDVTETADLARYYCEQMEKNGGFDRPMSRFTPNEETRSVLKPYGVWVIISPFNFPFALAGGPVSGALVAGNTVVLKPSHETPLTALALHNIFREAGVPAGALHLVFGTGPETGEALTSHPAVDGILFTGSKAVGMNIYHRFSQNYPKPCITEMGGKNPAIVMASANLEDAAEGVMKSAFGLQGQKCSACSRIYVQRRVKDTFLDLLLQKTKAITIGDPSRHGIWLGPLIHQRAYKDYAKYAELAWKDGKVLTGGKALTDGDLAHGYFVAPTLVDGLPTDHYLFQNELFQPMACIAPFEALDEALELANGTEYGLTAGFFSADPKDVDRFLEKIEAGVVYVNRKAGATTGAWPGVQPFGGWKGSGSSGKASGGLYYVQQFMREQSRTIVH